jgi:hypothetical protein
MKFNDEPVVTGKILIDRNGRQLLQYVDIDSLKGQQRLEQASDPPHVTNNTSELISGIR